jgi:hypothetical protein
LGLPPADLAHLSSEYRHCPRLIDYYQERFHRPNHPALRKVDQVYRTVESGLGLQVKQQW